MLRNILIPSKLTAESLTVIKLATTISPAERRTTNSLTTKVWRWNLWRQKYLTAKSPTVSNLSTRRLAVKIQKVKTFLAKKSVSRKLQTKIKLPKLWSWIILRQKNFVILNSNGYNSDSMNSDGKKINDGNLTYFFLPKMLV